MTVPEIDEKFDEKAHATHIESAAGHDEWSHIRSDAIIAEDKERAMGVIEGLKTYPAAVFWSFCISCCIIMEGYDTAVLGNVIGLPQFRQKFGTFIDEENGYQLSAAWQTAIGQAPNIGCLFGITLASYCQDRWGYKRTLQAGLVFLVGCIFIVFFAPSIEVLFAGEFLCGLPWGAFSSSAVSYASDVTPVALRGYLTTYVNLCWIIGQILAAGILYRVLDIESEWAYKIAFAIQWVWPIPLFIAITLAPESPWFLVRKGRLEDAKRVVQRLARKGDTVDPAQTVAMMVRTNQLEIDNNTQGSFADCFKRTDRRRTEIACLGWLCQVLCGMVFAGSPVYFLQQAGMSTNNTFQVNLGITFMAFAGTCLSWIALTFGGRRPFFIGGMIVMGVIIYIIGGLGFAADHNQNIRWGQAALIMIFVFTYDFTVGPLAYCVVGETSATRLRAKSVGLARMTYNLGNIVCGILNTYMVNPTAWNLKSRSALLWAGTNTVMTVWCYFRLPEMRGRTYRELDILFEREVPARDFKKTVVTDEDDA